MVIHLLDPPKLPDQAGNKIVNPIRISLFKCGLLSYLLHWAFSIYLLHWSFHLGDVRCNIYKILQMEMLGSFGLWKRERHDDQSCFYTADHDLLSLAAKSRAWKFCIMVERGIFSRHVNFTDASWYWDVQTKLNHTTTGIVITMPSWVCVENVH